MRRGLVLLTLFIGVSPAGWWLAKACAPDFLIAVFSYKRHPDLPRSHFIDGQIGVLQPTFARSYLVIAYRYLNGIGMNPREREQAGSYYDDRSSGAWDVTGRNWSGRWRTIRSTIKPPSPPPFALITNGQLAYDPETHSFTLNCAEDAFRTAVHTLEARRSRFGAASLAFRAWLDAQDKVFANCQGRSALVPPEATPDLPAIIRADRSYQIAAAHFYAGNDQMALDRFQRIGADVSSPWNSISRYLVVRTLLRMTEDKQKAVAAGARLRTEAENILADPQLTPIHGMTWNLVERAGIRERDQAYFRDLARLLSSKGQDDGLREELWNYTDLYDRMIDQADPNLVFRPEKPEAADVSRFRGTDLSDWILSFQSRDSSQFPHSLARWTQTHSLAWLLAALSHASLAAANSNGLAAAAAAIPEASPGYLTAQFHLLRLREAAGDKSGARDVLDTLLTGPLLRDLPSSANLFRGLRMLAAPTLGDFVNFAVRKPVMITVQTDPGEGPGYHREYASKVRIQDERFDRDATQILNRQTPFRLLKQMALDSQLPADARREALMTAFVRGLMLGEDLSQIASRLGDVQAELAPLTVDYLSEQSEERRRFAAAYLVLRRPEARPYFAAGISRQTGPGRLDDYRDNWWCPMEIEQDLDANTTNPVRLWETPNLLQHAASGVAADFLSTEDATEAQKEFAELAKLMAATDFLGGIVLPYAGLHKDDPRVPEALHNLVRSGHYGCADSNTWKTSRAAFRLLHLNYPRSEWTAKTPTWFKN